MDHRDGWISKGGLRQQKLAQKEEPPAPQETQNLHENRKVEEEWLERRSGLKDAQGPAGRTMKNRQLGKIPGSGARAEMVMGSYSCPEEAVRKGTTESE